MQLLELTLDDPAANVALDEALLEDAEQGVGPSEMLRIWEPQAPLVVVGRSSRVAVEVKEQHCRRRGIPILRRSSGGAAILAGPGCLMYAVVLSLEKRPALHIIDEAHRFVLEKIASGLSSLVDGVACRGISDLALDGKKISGNSMRCKRSHLLYHGTLLYDFPLAEIGACLGMPPRQPDYRQQRSHNQFVGNLPASGDDIRRAVIQAFSAETRLEHWPQERTSRLVEQKYSQPDWNFRW